MHCIHGRTPRSRYSYVLAIPEGKLLVYWHGASPLTFANSQLALPDNGALPNAARYAPRTSVCTQLNYSPDLCKSAGCLYEAAHSFLEQIGSCVPPASNTDEQGDLRVFEGKFEGAA